MTKQWAIACGMALLASIGLTGAAATAPTVSLTPASLWFGNQTVNTTSAAQIATLTNGGTSPLVISSIGLSGTDAPDFSRTYTCPIGGTGLAVGASCTIRVKFRPTATGPRSADLVVNDNGDDSPRTAALSGTGE